MVKKALPNRHTWPCQTRHYEVSQVYFEGRVEELNRAEIRFGKLVLELSKQFPALKYPEDLGRQLCDAAYHSTEISDEAVHNPTNKFKEDLEQIVRNASSLDELSGVIHYEINEDATAFQLIAQRNKEKEIWVKTNIWQESGRVKESVEKVTYVGWQVELKKVEPQNAEILRGEINGN